MGNLVLKNTFIFLFILLIFFVLKKQFTKKKFTRKKIFFVLCGKMDEIHRFLIERRFFFRVRDTLLFLFCLVKPLCKLNALCNFYCTLCSL